MSLSHEELKLLRNLQHKFNDAATQIDMVLKAHIASDPTLPSPESVKIVEDVKAALDKNRIALIGTPAHCVAQYFAKTLGKGSDSVQLDWAQDLQRVEQLHGKEQLTVWILWASTNPYWKSRITSAKKLVTNLAQIAVQCNREQQSTKRTESTTVQQAPTTVTFRMTDQICAPTKPTHEDHCRVQHLVEQHTEQVVRDVLDYTLQDKFWFPKLTTYLFAEKFELLKQQALRSTLTAPTKSINLPGRGSTRALDYTPTAI